MIAMAAKAERVLLLGVRLKRGNELLRAEDSLTELGELVRSAGAHVVASVIQPLERPTRSYVGKGKLEEVKRLATKHSVGTVVCDDELTPTQQAHLESALEDIKIIDRTALILDVFAMRAQTREGSLQVELAQHEYLLPRLAGQWSHLERLGGGIGTRGPGETQLETDRRLVRARILRLRKGLEDVRRHRSLYRERRKEQRIPVVSLVGYTNAGKSTLLNRLTGAGVAVENRLFSTLDPVTRRVMLPSGRELLLTDTVGFIQKLPTLVVAAFRATLEEVEESSVIVHVVDITHHNAPEQAHAVHEILGDLGLSAKPVILVLNKIDLLTPHDQSHNGRTVQEILPPQRTAVMCSALTGEGLEHLLSELGAILAEPIAHSVRAGA